MAASASSSAIASSSFHCCINLRAGEKSGGVEWDRCEGGPGAGCGASCAKPSRLAVQRSSAIHRQQTDDERCINLVLTNTADAILGAAMSLSNAAILSSCDLPEMGVELSGAIEFPRGFLGIPLLSQSLRQLVVSGGVLVGHLDGRTKLRNRTFHISCGKQPPSRICGERCGLEIIVRRRKARCRPGLLRGSGGVALLAQHRGQGRVSTSKIGL